MRKALLMAAALCLLAPAAASAQHIVKEGDTMSKIAKQYKMSLERVIELNPHINNINLIYPNQHINVKSDKLAEDIIGYARSLQDLTKYEYGGKDAPFLTDCSGWMQHIFAEFGIKLPRVSREQAKIGKPVKFEELQKGDLMFFSVRDDKVITHVGLYIGDDLWISNLNEKKSVEILSVWGDWSFNHFLYGKRIL